MAKIETQRHVLTFTGSLPADEMERHALLTKNPEILASRQALAAAFTKAGFKHEHTSKLIRDVSGRKPRQTKVPAEDRAIGAPPSPETF